MEHGESTPFERLYLKQLSVACVSFELRVTPPIWMDERSLISAGNIYIECFVVFQEAYPGIQPEVTESAFNRVV